MPDRQDILDLHREYMTPNGPSLAELGGRLGVSYETVRLWFERENLPRRSSAEVARHRQAAREAAFRAEAERRREEIEQAYRQHGNVEDTADDIDLPMTYIAEVVRAMPDRELHRRRNTPQQRTDAELIRDLQRAARVEGEPLTIPAYRRAATALRLASYDTHAKRWGDWQSACKAAGVKCNPGTGRRADSYSREDAVAWVRRYIVDTGETTYTGYAGWARGGDAPSGETVRKFGWRDVLAEALADHELREHRHRDGGQHSLQGDVRPLVTLSGERDNSTDRLARTCHGMTLQRDSHA